MSRPPTVKKNIGEKRREKRDAIWPDAHRVVYSSTVGGWTQMPRTAPMIATLIDEVSGKQNPGRLYLVLWAYEFGDGFVEVPDPAQLAIEAGYRSGRAERTFSERMRTLAELGFIRTEGVGLRQHSYVLLVDPHTHVVRWRRRAPEKIPETWWTAFQARCSTIGISLTAAQMEPGIVVRPRRKKAVSDRTGKPWLLEPAHHFTVLANPSEGWVPVAFLGPPAPGAEPFNPELPVDELEPVEAIA